MKPQKLYLICYTSNDKLELATGVMIVSSSSSKKAKEAFRKNNGDAIISIISCCIIKPTKEGLLVLDHEPTIQ